MPAGDELTVPLPVPALLTVRISLTTVRAKDAVTEVAAFSATWQVPVPAQAPPHPENADPRAAVAVRVTTVPGVKLVLQAAPQLTPAGLDTSVPAPVPARVTVRVAVTGFGLPASYRARAGRVKSLGAPAGSTQGHGLLPKKAGLLVRYREAGSVWSNP